jgi:hypothetical protein
MNATTSISGFDRKVTCWRFHKSLLAFFLAAAPAFGGSRDIDERLHHLRNGNQREWADFPAKAEGSTLTVRFQSTANKTEHALRLRQQDVRQS